MALLEGGGGITESWEQTRPGWEGRAGPTGVMEARGAISTGPSPTLWLFSVRPLGFPTCHSPALGFECLSVICK